jgi:hypothetical protein
MTRDCSSHLQAVLAVATLRSGGQGGHSDGPGLSCSISNGVRGKAEAEAQACEVGERVSE